MFVKKTCSRRQSCVGTVYESNICAIPAKSLYCITSHKLRKFGNSFRLTASTPRDLLVHISPLYAIPPKSSHILPLRWESPSYIERCEIRAMFKLYWIAFVPEKKPYRIWGLSPRMLLSFATSTYSAHFLNARSNIWINKFSESQPNSDYSRKRIGGCNQTVWCKSQL